MKPLPKQCRHLLLGFLGWEPALIHLPKACHQAGPHVEDSDQASQVLQLFSLSLQPSFSVPPDPAGAPKVSCREEFSMLLVLNLQN